MPMNMPMEALGNSLPALVSLLSGGGKDEPGKVVPENLGGKPLSTSTDPNPGAPTLTDDDQRELLDLQKKIARQALWSRRLDIRKKRKSRYYWAGQQDIYWNGRVGDFEGIQVGPAGTARPADEERDEVDPGYTFNKYRWCGQSLIAVLSSSPPTVRFYPESAENSDDQATAAAANSIWELFSRTNHLEEVQATEAWLLYNDGIYGLYVRHVVDAQRFGTHPEPIILPVPHEVAPDRYECPGCGATTPGNPPQPNGDTLTTCQNPMCQQPMSAMSFRPRETQTVDMPMGTKDVPNGAELVEVVGGLNLFVPPNGKDIDEFPYLIWRDEVERSVVKAMYPDAADKLGKNTYGNGPEEEWERNVRLMIKGRSGPYVGISSADDNADLLTLTRTWLRPSSFWRIEDKDKRERFLKLFSGDGCLMVSCGDLLLETRQRSMSKDWVVCHAYPGEGQVRESIGDIMLDAQDAGNDLINLEIDAARHGVRTTFADIKLFSQDAINQQKIKPAQIQPITLNSGDTAGAHFWETGVPTLSEATTALREEILGPLSEGMTGALPAIQGQSDKDIKTATGYRMARDQALGRLGIPWRSMKHAHARMAKLAVEAFIESRKPLGMDVTYSKPVEGGFKNVTIKMTDLEGRFLVFPEADETYPMTMGDKRTVYEGLLQSPNQYLNGIGTSPENMQVIKGVLGLTGLQIPGESAREQQRREIQELVRSEPQQQLVAQPPMQDPATGQVIQPPPQPTLVPSVPIDQDFDDHEVHFQTIQEWLEKEEAQALKMTNQGAWMNVRLHGLAHKQAMMPPPMPAPGPGGPPQDPGPGPQAMGGSAPIPQNAMQSNPQMGG